MFVSGSWMNKNRSNGKQSIENHSPQGDRAER